MKYLIAGLGNIGDEYINTRHNIGFTILDALAAEYKVAFELKRLAYVATFKTKGRIFILIKPSTFMNLSGKAIKYWLQKENISIENSLTVLDDIALPHGTLRMKPKGNDGGHNGLTSIIEQLNTTEFPRLRFGVGNDFAKGYQSDYVLGKWTKTEEKAILPRIALATEMIISFGTRGIEQTMNAYNKL